MARSVVAGIDGSAESRAAAEWAAREAKLRGLPLRLVHVWEPLPEPTARTPLRPLWSERSEPGPLPDRGRGSIPPQTAEGLALRHPGVDVTVEELNGRPADVLADAAGDADPLVLGSRGLSGVSGFLVGSVGLAVVARARTPVVLVRAGEQAADEHEADPAGIPSAATPFRPVVLGLDAHGPADAVLAFAFEEAARRGCGLRAVYGWNLPPYYAYGLSVDLALHDEIARLQSAALAEAVRPWRAKHPDVEVVEVADSGSGAGRLIDASAEACLVVVGRRVRRGSLGARIGSVTHAVLHHSTVPVAVVPHD